MGIYNTDSLNMLNEVYFGQTKGITEVFEKFCDFRDKYITNRKVFMGNINADHDPDLNEFCRLVEKEFNIGSFTFIVEDNDAPNMCTINPFFESKESSRCLSVSKNGYKFKNGTKLVMIIIAPTGLLFNSSFTNRELFGIFLHEVGHNFQELLNGNMYSLSQVNSVLLVYQLMMEYIYNTYQAIKDTLTVAVFTAPVLSELSKSFNKITSKNTNNVYSYYNCISGILKNIKRIGTSAITTILKPVLYPIIALQHLIGQLSNPIGAIHGYYGEKMADKFASYYGFGPDLSTALLKMDSIEMNTSSEYVINQVPLLSHFINVISIPGQILMSMVDVHPGSGTRIKVIHEALENDLKDPRIPQSTKKDIQKELDIMDENIDKFFNTATKIDNPYFAKNAFNRFIYASCGGGIKHAFSEEFIDSDKEVNNTYYKYNNESVSLISKVDIK